ncbi:hypothetical protein ALC57_12164 [Trachymyrmex cornetzi]|uniref:BED-type domain-containing protein n=1 Tax=Trachymyrmex cornetzi TaxID=471704 RepID=A0A195DS36_9HYME|nr:hypothetical protein ALC57_12164 [Trachymyrmex cornetzi]
MSMSRARNDRAMSSKRINDMNSNSENDVCESEIRPKKVKDFYEIIKNKKQNKTGTCKLCSEKGENTIIKMTNSGTSGLIRHLSSKHEKQFRSYFPEKIKQNDAQGNQTITHLFNKEDNGNVSTPI